MKNDIMKTTTRMALLAIVTGMTGCVSQQSVQIDTRTSSEIPRDRAIAFLKDYVLPPNAEKHVARMEKFRDDKKKYACDYGAGAVTFKDGGRTLPYAQLRFDAMDIKGGGLAGGEDGVYVRIMPDSSLSPICYVTLVPGNYPADDAKRELQKLGTAMSAAGIRQR